LATIVLVLLGTIIVFLTQPYWPMLAGLLVLAGAVALAFWVARRYAIGLTAVIVIGGVLALASQLTASTPPIRDARGSVVAGSIASMEKVRLGGVDQWVVIRGKNANNPVLLFLSGGPGGTETGWNRLWIPQLEDHFVVVNWEQRGAGKSAGLLLSDWSHMTPQQYVADALQLTQFLRQRFHQDKIYIVGHSWGSMVGIWMAQQRPELFAAYVGIGQMVNPTLNDQMGYQYVLDKAREAGNTALIKKLEANGPPPYHGLGMLKYNDYLDLLYSKYIGEAILKNNPKATWNHGSSLIDSVNIPEFGLADKVATVPATDLTFMRVYDQLGNVDYQKQIPELKLPVYFATGRYDLSDMAVLTERYYQALKNPQKHLVWFEASGHAPIYEQTPDFLNFMIKTVLANTGR
jgi:pimeloyl-ACP methyl ester carboxylesterase